jgi:hypothetical protein
VEATCDRVAAAGVTESERGIRQRENGCMGQRVVGLFADLLLDRLLACSHVGQWPWALVCNGLKSSGGPNGWEESS